MSELTLLVLRLAFLILMWAFVFMVIYALRSDLFGTRARKLPEAAPVNTFPAAVPAAVPVAAVATVPAPVPVAAQRSQPHADATTPRRLVITSGPKEGMEIELPSEQLTIGRSGESGLVIRDDYTSTHHARLMVWNEEWMLQDLDSTNGTFLDGKRVTSPVNVPLNTPIKIGATSFELRR